MMRIAARPATGLPIDLTWSTLQTLQRRDLIVYVRSIGTYIVSGLALLTSALMIRSNLAYAANNNGLIVVANPMTLPLFVTALILTAFLALNACATVAREFDQGTVEVLFYGPVDAASYVIAKFLAMASGYVLLLLLVVLNIIVASWLTNLRLSGDMAAGAVLSIFTSAASIAFAIWLASMMQRPRTAVLTLVGAMLFLLALQVGDSFLSVAASAAGADSPVYYLDQIVHVLNNVVTWLSPFGYLLRGMNAVANGQSWVYLLTLAVSIAFTLTFLALAILTIRFKGIRR
jgi:ABC-type transport system involved in multi-copper enzyme maturation permease subunit